MKQWLIIGGVVTAVLMQFCLLQAWPQDWLLPNVTLALLVVLSFYMDIEFMMWVALGVGLFSDWYSHVEFGFYLGLYILVVLLCKIIFNFGPSERSWWRGGLLIAAAGFVQAVVVALPIITGPNTVQLQNLAEKMGWFVVSTTLFGLLLIGAIELGSGIAKQYLNPKVSRL